MPAMELWGGVECTINRVNDRYFNQMERSGHLRRPSDIAMFAGLGLKRLRYPYLWEMVCPDGDSTNPDWSWTDERHALLQRHGIKPIAGLLHHGSGPLITSLVDPDFPQRFADYALLVARRYPDLVDYTPVNEPLTTARFSALYGIWYPHHRDAGMFARALVNECRATVLAMQAIRSVNPNARLIQTEDLGTIYSTGNLAYQAEYENERRWLSLDLLSGRVDRGHPMWSTLKTGVTSEDIEFFQKNPCPPDLIGINYYVSSDQYLDHRMDKYPSRFHGGNDREPYANILAVHSKEAGIMGHKQALMLAWERYHLPLAITEVHLDCSRDEQLRWIKEAWNGARSARAEGANVKAITIWALLGSYDWNSLVTCDCGYYEPGAFDLRTRKEPRPTAIARVIQMISRDGDYYNPILDTQGWWRRPCRLKTRKARVDKKKMNGGFRFHRSRPLLITGERGTLGHAFARICEYRGLSYRLVGRDRMDIANPLSVKRVLEQIDPWAVINTAGYVKVDDAEEDCESCFRENTTGVKTLAAACDLLKIPFLTFSSDLVFDGTQAGYVESDQVSPLNVYGQSKAQAEAAALRLCEKALIVRTSSFFGPWDEYNFLTLALRRWQEGLPVIAPSDLISTPTYVPDLVHASLDLLFDHETGIWHVTNEHPLSWSDFASQLATMLDVPSHLIQDCSSGEMGYRAARPRSSALMSERGKLLSSLHSCLEKYIEDIESVSMPSFRETMSRLQSTEIYDGEGKK